MTKDYSGERFAPKVLACTMPSGEKAAIRLVFNKDTLVLYGGKKLHQYNAASGLQKKYEPIPKGRYWINPAELWTRSLATDAAVCALGAFDEKLTCADAVRGHRSSWGNHRITIHPYPTTKTGDRGGFFIHGGAVFGSAGCIDLAGGMDRFVKDLLEVVGGEDASCFVELTVR